MELAKCCKFSKVFQYASTTKSSTPGVCSCDNLRWQQRQSHQKRKKTVISKLEKIFWLRHFIFFFTNILVSPWLKRFKIDKLHSLRPVYPVQDIVLKNLINLHLRESSGLPPPSHSSQLTMQSFSLWSTILMVPKSQF